MEKKFVTVDSNKIAYKETGRGEAVVLLHGFCGSSSYWDAIQTYLPSDYRFIFPDLRGHGDSDAPDGSYSMDVMADDMDRLLQQLGVEKATLLGHSLGGYVSLAFAERHMEKLTRFGFIHSTALPDDEKGKEGRLNSMKTIREQGLNVFVNGLIPKLFAPAHVEQMTDRVEAAKKIGYGTHPDGAIRTLEGMRTRPDRSQVILDAKVPVLLVAGEHDQLISRERAFSATSNYATQHVIPKAGHMSMMETPKQLAEVIHAFLKVSG
ncbi:alpha/beta fold hydrolase [Paenibacillus hamazuiensis]|uniref:alpha/beta fold hydrolase n=1 Tax=Paenibacillus hamazuiensis TaxID=2936508 RepID=UPI00200DEA31|nr:alpha/beta hydrolase [Paenibacillus hamazuiensis]